MKKLTILLLLCTGAFLFNLSAQNKKIKPYYADRYGLDLPKEWNKPKLIEAITFILSRKTDTVKDKQFCTGCKAGITVMLVIDSPFVRSNNYFFTSSEKYVNAKGYRYVDNHYTHDIVFQFRAALGLFDTAGTYITDLLLIGPEEEYSIKNGVVVREGKPPPVPGPISLGSKYYLSHLVNLCEKRIFQIRDNLLNPKEE